MCPRVDIMDGVRAVSLSESIANSGSTARLSFVIRSAASAPFLTLTLMLEEFENRVVETLRLRVLANSRLKL